MMIHLCQEKRLESSGDFVVSQVYEPAIKLNDSVSKSFSRMLHYVFRH